MTNGTNVTDSLVLEELPGLEALEPYLGHELVSQIQNADSLVISIGFIIISVIIATLVLVFLKISAKFVARRTKTELDDKLIEAMEQPIFRLIIIAGFYFAVANLGIQGATIEFVLRLVITLGYLTVIRYILNSIEIFVKYGVKTLAEKTESHFDDEIVPIFHKAAIAVVWAFGLIMILGIWGVNVTPFIAGLGIAGLAISFAMQSTLSNIISGISIIMDKTYKVGDKIQIDSGEIGVIHEITLRSTRLRTYNNEIIIIPNNNMAGAKIKNFTQPDHKIRVVVPFTVEYGNSPDKVTKIIKEAIEKNIKDVLQDPPVKVVFLEMADFSLNFEAWFWVEDYTTAFDKKLEGNDLIYNTLGKNKIGIPFPTRTIYTKKG